MGMDKWRRRSVHTGPLDLLDNDMLRFGNAQDATLEWDGTNLELLPKTDDTGSFNIGNGTLDFDVKIFLSETTKYALFDVGNALLTLEDVDLKLGDNDILQFGDASGGDVYGRWDGTDFDMLAAANNTIWKWGNGTNSFDMWWYGSAAANYMEWDASANALYLRGAASLFQQAASANVVGSGVALSATKTAAMSVFADDGNAAIASSVLTRAGRFRNVQVYTGGNREQEALGAIGQIVSVAGTNRHNMAGLMGSYEAVTSLTVDGQASATDPWIQAGVIGRVGVGSAITTINANGKLIGVAAMSNTASFSANNGAYIGFYAGRWGTNADWGYGVFMENVDVGIKFTADLQSIDSVVSALGATAIGNSFYVTVTAPNNQSGMAAYFDATIKGTTAGHCYGVGSWINADAGTPVLSAGHIIVPFEGGVWTNNAQANARIVFAGQHQAVLNGAPASLHAWRLNTTHTITALIAAANSGSVGYAASTATTSNKVGDVPIFDIAGGVGVRYIRLYDAAG